MLNFKMPEVKLDPRSKEIHERAVRRAKKYLVAEGELLSSILEVDKDETYRKFGEAYLTPYCEKYLGLTDHVAGMFVRIARKCLEVPALELAVQKGLSVSKAKVILPVITSENAARWIGKAFVLPRKTLEKEVARLNPSAKRKERIKAVGEDRHHVEYETSDKGEEMLKRATDLLCARLGRVPTLAEVQYTLVDEFLEHNDPVRKAKRNQSRQQDTTRVAPKTKSEVVHTVNLRDEGKCQALLADGTKCGLTRWVEHHHIVPRAEGGKDTAENLITLCSAHHKMWHRHH